MTRRTEPRRILFITYEYPPLGGGIGKATRNLARSMAAKGYKVAILTSRFGNLPRDEMQHGFRVLRIPVLRRHLNYANAYEVLSFAISGIIHSGWLLRRFKPDATIALLTIPSGIVAEFIRWRTGTRWLNFLRGQDVPGFPDTPAWMHKLAWPVTAYLWRRAHRMMANSQGLADLAHESMPGVRIDVVPNIVDMDTYAPPAAPRAHDRIRVLYLGRIVTFKRLRELLVSWKIVCQRTEAAAELRIGGFGPQREELEALCREFGIADSVQFLGRLDEAEVVKALHNADIFINPSSGEGLPNAVQEAMATGLPVALSDIPMHHELLKDEKGGILFDGADPQSIADAMLKLIEEPELRAQCGVAAREIIVDHFSAASITDRMLELLNQK